MTWGERLRLGLSGIRRSEIAGNPNKVKTAYILEYGRIEAYCSMRRKLIVPFTMFILLLAACTSASSPTLGPEMQPVTPQSSNVPTPPPTSQAIGCDRTLTPAQTEGPFYTPNSPERSTLVEAGMGGTQLLVTGKVIDQNCEPMAGVMLDFWQTDDQGEYDNVGYRMRGHQFTDENGQYALETILPSRYPGRTPHIHVKVFASDGQELLTTQIYFPGASEQIPDGIFRPDLLARELEPDTSGRRRVEFDFVLPD